MAYLTDTTNLISNPGIRPGVRQDVLNIVQITSAWKNMSYDRFVKPFVKIKFLLFSDLFNNFSAYGICVKNCLWL